MLDGTIIEVKQNRIINALNISIGDYGIFFVWWSTQANGCIGRKFNLRRRIIAKFAPGCDSLSQDTSTSMTGSPVYSPLARTPPGLSPGTWRWRFSGYVQLGRSFVADCCGIVWSLVFQASSRNGRKRRAATGRHWTGECCVIPGRTFHFQAGPRGTAQGRNNHMSLSTADYFGPRAAEMQPVAQTDGVLKVLALANAALAAISLVVMFMVGDPWLAALVFTVTYTLFWIMRGAME
jgi:hypothetical protein